jgi:hypothetical protein
MLDEQPVPPVWPPLYEYYISKIIILDDCDINSVDLIHHYKEIIDEYIMPRFAGFLFASGNLVVRLCESGDANIGHNIVRVGHPSCITDAYTVTDAIPPTGPLDPGGFNTYRTITNCVSFSPESICYSLYEYCFPYPGALPRLTKKVDGNSSINCPARATVSAGNAFTPPNNLIEVNCHPVCNMKLQPAVSIAEATIADISVSPNPTSNETTLTFTVLSSGNLEIKLVNVSGQELMELHSAYTEAGDFTKNFTLAKLPAGVYYLRIAHNNKVKMEKVIRN